MHMYFRKDLGALIGAGALNRVNTVFVFRELDFSMHFYTLFIKRCA